MSNHGLEALGRDVDNLAVAVVNLETAVTIAIVDAADAIARAQIAAALITAGLLQPAFKETSFDEAVDKIMGEVVYKKESTI